MTDDRFKPLEDASVARDKAVRELIVEEIKAMIPGAIEREERAAAALREASDALVTPQAELARLADEIGMVRGRTSQWAEQTYSDQAETRVRARTLFREWDAELTSLEEQYHKLEQEAEQLQVRKNKASADLENASLERMALEENACTEMAYFGAGKRTDAYRTFRFGWCDLVTMLRPGNEDHPERDEALRWLEILCLWSGYRTDDLPKDGDAWKRHWDDIYANANPVEPAPTAKEVMQRDIDALEREIVREQDIRWNRPAR